MALDYFDDITTVFGPSATLTGTGSNAVLSFKPAETGINNNFSAPENATAEGLVLALLQRLTDTALITQSRALEIGKSALLSIKNGQQAYGEQFVVRIFADGPPAILDPDSVRNLSSSSSSSPSPDASSSSSPSPAASSSSSPSSSSPSPAASSSSSPSSSSPSPAASSSSSPSPAASSSSAVDYGGEDDFYLGSSSETVNNGGEDDTPFSASSSSSPSPAAASSSSLSSATVTVPGAPTITTAYYDADLGGTNVFWSAPASDGGSAIVGYEVYFGGDKYTPTTIVSSTHYRFIDNFSGEIVQVSANNAAGEGPLSAGFTVE